MRHELLTAQAAFATWDLIAVLTGAAAPIPKVRPTCSSIRCRRIGSATADRLIVHMAELFNQRRQVNPYSSTGAA